METNTEVLLEKSSVYVVEYIPRPRSQIINDDLHLFILSINLGLICQTIAVFGVVSNVINITIFLRQGFTDCINISLLALAVSDFLSMSFLIWSNLCYTPFFRRSVYPLVTEEIHLVSGGWPHVTFTRTTGWITMFISFERCMCVTLPLKVKNIFTRQRHAVAMVTIFILTVGPSTLGYAILGIGWKFYPERNDTLIGLVYLMEGGQKRLANYINYTLIGVVMPIACFSSVLIFTIILIVKLNQQAAWRQSRTTVANDNQQSQNAAVKVRDQKIAKMIVLISSIFIISFLPAVAIFVASCFEPELNYDGVYKNTFIVTMYTSFAADAINSSINIFIYFGMSTKYRETFIITMKCSLCKK